MMIDKVVVVCYCCFIYMQWPLAEEQRLSSMCVAHRTVNRAPLAIAGPLQWPLPLPLFQHIRSLSLLSISICHQFPKILNGKSLSDSENRTLLVVQQPKRKIKTRWRSPSDTQHTRSLYVYHNIMMSVKSFSCSWIHVVSCPWNNKASGQPWLRRNGS